ncbi:NUDIX domain-containing protein [Cohaesibacter marisflavi]|uniref:NUDIX domain-containing protein n=1 Tax=Cohaesibacter marisflavi TaxID=655353 RepID=UPI0029C6E299|nr:NUDIX domain-containing protein [Cohaesibacter marisflavi]
MSTKRQIRTIRENLVFENKWLRLYNDEVQFPDGSTGTYIFKEWTAPYGVAIVITKGSEALLLENHRYKEQNASVEIPQGFGEVNETPLSGALRELSEETGITGTNLVSIRSLISFGQAKKTHVFHAIAHSKLTSPSNPEASEVLGKAFWIDLRNFDANTASLNGIFDPLTVASLMLVRSELDLD